MDKYFNVLLPKISKLQYSNGGPIILVQVENEYGSYGGDHSYLTHIQDIMIKKYSINIPLFASNGATTLMLSGGATSKLFKTVNFGVGADVSLQYNILRQFQPIGPLFCSEYWDGWFDHWLIIFFFLFNLFNIRTEKHHTTNVTDTANTLDQILAYNSSVNMYMYHGGTNFNFMNGANFDGISYQPTITSYDYDAPLNESGDPTPKFFAIKEVIKKYLPVPQENPKPSPKSDYGIIEITEMAPLFDFNNLEDISTKFYRSAPIPMELLGQNYGFILYRTFINLGVLPPVDLNIQNLADRALIYLDGIYQGVIERANNSKIVTLSNIQAGSQLDILVENMGRINYGNYLMDFKGITQGVRLDYQFIFNWTIFTLPLSNLSRLNFGSITSPVFPSFYRTQFTATNPILDTFIQLPGWKKGVVWINGFNLGRYWYVGPQNYLYLPAPFLKSGKNELIIFELEGFNEANIQLNSYPHHI